MGRPISLIATKSSMRGIFLTPPQNHPFTVFNSALQEERLSLKTGRLSLAIMKEFGRVKVSRSAILCLLKRRVTLQSTRRSRRLSLYGPCRTLDLLAQVTEVYFSHQDLKSAMKITLPLGGITGSRQRTA